MNGKDEKISDIVARMRKIERYKVIERKRGGEQSESESKERHKSEGERDSVEKERLK